MLSKRFLKGKEELLRMLTPGAALTSEMEQKLVEVYGRRGKRAIEAIRNGLVIRRGHRWFVRGRGGEYEVVKTMCTCQDYLMNIATGRADVDMCYHALAKTVCERTQSYYVVEQVNET